MLGFFVTARYLEDFYLFPDKNPVFQLTYVPP